MKVSVLSPETRRPSMTNSERTIVKTFFEPLNLLKPLFFNPYRTLKQEPFRTVLGPDTTDPLIEDSILGSSIF